ncbi:hypothetical protein GN330_12135 [Nitratireductor sp. CAU 1489]|uniref:TauD/TfdA-like domain-containing protein n=1 Tax=Nitratireductor arenosus TaxID=2682096 RepID=A0A844QIZ4_9HYPH|nr:TauD/TfdA family dioxygenase [Nitratireductor arenosus]MVA97993.1 hypothetical protein [Nitratireductor arenosus]
MFAKHVCQDACSGVCSQCLANASDRVQTAALAVDERKILELEIDRFAAAIRWPDEPDEQAAIGGAARALIRDTLPHVSQLLRQAKNGKLDALYITGLPTDEVRAQLALLGMSRELGMLFNYSSQNEGRLIMELRPLQESAANTNSTRDEFDIHTDDAAMPREARTEFINLYGIQNPPGTLTSYSPVGDALLSLDREHKEVLSEPRFRVRFPISFGVGTDRWSQPCAIVTRGPSNEFELRFPSYATRPIASDDTLAAAALVALKTALNQRAVGMPLDPGCFLTFNNLRGAHKRGAIGSGDRLVFRTYSVRSLELLRKVTGQPGPIFPVDPFVTSLTD